MNKPTRLATSARLVLAAIALVLAGAIAGITGWLRADLRAQILRREGESLHAVMLMQQTLESDRAGPTGAHRDDEQLVILALQISRLRGVIGVQVLDQRGQSIHTMPTTLERPTPSDREWPTLRALAPVVRFSPHASLGALYGLDNDASEQSPLLEILVPLHQPASATLDGVAHYVIEGQFIAQEFRSLDQGLIWQASLVWALAASVSVGGVGFVLRRLAHANSTLLARTEDLLQANRALSLAAKTSALGAVTAHLVHGLRNPIAGLEAFIEEQRPAESRQQNSAWREAEATAGRMRSMVSEVITLLQEESAGTSYELASHEILATVLQRIAAVSTRQQVTVTIAANTSDSLTNNQAGLVTAILVNLAQNACEAVTAGSGQVKLIADRLSSGSQEFRVEDNGPGLSAEAVAELFRPKQSRKPGGAGIGLAISRQLAIHLGGSLELVTTGPAGTSWQLVIPKTSSPSAGITTP